MMECYLADDDFTVAESWRLVDWCHQHGADEFTIDCLGADSHVDEKAWAPFESTVHSSMRGERLRRRMSSRTAADLTRLTDLWTLNDVTLPSLQRALPGGFLNYDFESHGCFGDPILYRDGELMLGVITHDSSAVLRITDTEFAAFSAAGFISHDSLPWIEY